MAGEWTLPQDPAVFTSWSWADYEPFYRDLTTRSVSSNTVESFLDDWTAVSDRASEANRRLYIATTRDTSDEAAADAYHHFLNEIFPHWQQSEQTIQQKFLESDLHPEGFAVATDRMRSQTALFRDENVRLLVQEQQLDERYNQISGAQTVEWEGQELPIEQIAPLLQVLDPSTRERAWRAARSRQLADRAALNDLWRDFLSLRLQLASNAGKRGYAEYRWQQMLRLDYAPEDSASFSEAIEEAVVPAATRVLERRRRRLGVKTLRPWDCDVDPLGREPLRPFVDVGRLTSGSSAIFDRVDTNLGKYFGTMIEEGLLDLDSRQNKAPGGFCDELAVQQRPYIFMNAVGTHEDVQTLLHEGGHAFHVFESNDLRWSQQRDVGTEFAEVASMGMEFLSGPYLADPEAGFYSQSEAARARVEHLETGILFWPYMAVVDSFQRWVYSHPRDASDPDECDAAWSELYRRYVPGEDWSGLEQELSTGWHRKLHIFTYPLYYVEYGLAQLGAVQIWANARRDQSKAVAQYRHALSLGATRSIPDLFAAAGATFSFGAGALTSAVELMEHAIAELDAVSNRHPDT